MKKTLNVVVGIIFHQQQVLLSERDASKPLGPCWEFPGGKIESNETPFTALCRELKEEIGITVVTAHALPQVTHDYAEYSVILHPWTIEHFTGEPQSCEKQRLKWVDFAALATEKLPAANHTILQYLKL